MKQYLGSLMAVVSALSACSSSNDGDGSVDGTIEAVPITVAAAVSTTLVDDDGNSFAYVVLSSDPDICSQSTNDTLNRNEDLIEITMSNDGSAIGTAPTAPGTFTVPSTATPSGPTASFDGGYEDSGCAPAFVDATSGTITLTGISNGVYSGTFDVTLVNDDHVSGSFDPVSCPGLVPFTPEVASCQ